jgi:hypothetical protein
MIAINTRLSVAVDKNEAFQREQNQEVWIVTEPVQK